MFKFVRINPSTRMAFTKQEIEIQKLKKQASEFLEAYNLAIEDSQNFVAGKPVLKASTEMLKHAYSNTMLRLSVYEGLGQLEDELSPEKFNEDLTRGDREDRKTQRPDELFGKGTSLLESPKKDKNTNSNEEESGFEKALREKLIKICNTAQSQLASGGSPAVVEAVRRRDIEILFNEYRDQLWEYVNSKSVPKLRALLGQEGKAQLPDEIEKEMAAQATSNLFGPDTSVLDKESHKRVKNIPALQRLYEWRPTYKKDVKKNGILEEVVSPNPFAFLAEKLKAPYKTLLAPYWKQINSETPGDAQVGEKGTTTVMENQGAADSEVKNYGEMQYDVLKKLLGREAQKFQKLKAQLSTMEKSNPQYGALKTEIERVKHMAQHMQPIISPDDLRQFDIEPTDKKYRDYPNGIGEELAEIHDQSVGPIPLTDADKKLYPKLEQEYLVCIRQWEKYADQLGYSMGKSDNERMKSVAKEQAEQNRQNAQQATDDKMEADALSDAKWDAENNNKDFDEVEFIKNYRQNRQNARDKAAQEAVINGLRTRYKNRVEKSGGTFAEDDFQTYVINQQQGKKHQTQDATLTPIIRKEVVDPQKQLADEQRLHQRRNKLLKGIPNMPPNFYKPSAYWGSEAMVGERADNKENGVQDTFSDTDYNSAFSDNSDTRSKATLRTIWKHLLLVSLAHARDVLDYKKTKIAQNIDPEISEAMKANAIKNVQKGSTQIAQALVLHYIEEEPLLQTDEAQKLIFGDETTGEPGWFARSLYGGLPKAQQVRLSREVERYTNEIDTMMRGAAYEDAKKELYPDVKWQDIDDTQQQQIADHVYDDMYAEGGRRMSVGRSGGNAQNAFYTLKADAGYNAYIRIMLGEVKNVKKHAEVLNLAQEGYDKYKVTMEDPGDIAEHLASRAYVKDLDPNRVLLEAVKLGLPEKALGYKINRQNPYAESYAILPSNDPNFESLERVKNPNKINQPPIVIDPSQVDFTEENMDGVEEEQADPVIANQIKESYATYFVKMASTAEAEGNIPLSDYFDNQLRSLVRRG